MSKIALDLLLKKVEAIEFETGDGKVKDKKKGKDDPDDEFRQLRRQIGQQIKKIREMIKERDEMNPKKVPQKEIVEKSAQVRAAIRAAKEDANKLRQMLQMAQTRKPKKGKPALTEEQLQTREDLVKLVFDHIEECEQLEKRRYTLDKTAKDRTKLLQGASAATARQTFSRSAVDTDLPDIDDPEVEEGLKRLRKRNEEIDQDLDQISKGVTDLRGVALTMNEEIKMQGQMIGELQNKVDKTAEHMKSTNEKMKALVEKVASPQRFCVDIILIVLFVGLLGVIYSVVKSK